MVDRIVNGLESFLRRFFERLGRSLDANVRRREVTRTDPSVLITMIERAVEKGLSEERGCLIAPSEVEVHLEYETWSRLGEERRDHLRRELRDNIREYVCNRRYLTRQPLEVRLVSDPFVRGASVRVGEVGSGLTATMTTATTGVATAKRLAVRLIESRTGREHCAIVQGGTAPVGIGRGIANEIIINESTLSKFHAALMIGHNGELELADRSSANGTAVNGTLLAIGDRLVVRDGDRLRLGDVDLLLIVEPA